MIDWQLLLAAFALMLVVEGILPFLSPQRLRQLMLNTSRLDDHALRIAGLVSMGLGLALLYLVH